MRAALTPIQIAFAGVSGPRGRMLVSVVICGLMIQVSHQVVMMFHSRLSAGTGHRMVRDDRRRALVQPLHHPRL